MPLVDLRVNAAVRPGIIAAVVDAAAIVVEEGDVRTRGDGVALGLAVLQAAPVRAAGATSQRDTAALRANFGMRADLHVVVLSRERVVPVERLRCNSAAKKEAACR